MGGFMPTPPAPAQPPQVKLDSTANSRGTFTSFLKNMNGATSLNPPSMAPSMGVTSPMLAPAANIDIFNQPVQNFQFGGFADDTVGDTSGSFSVDDQGNVSDDFSIGGGGFGGTGSDEQSFQDALDQAVEQASQFGGGQDAVNVFADDPAVVDRRGVNVGLESRGGFSAGVVPGLKGERFARFENVPFAMRGIARDFRSKINNAGDDGITVSNYFNTFNPSDDNKDRLAEFESLTGKKAGDKLNINDMQNIMNIQAKYEAGIRDVPGSVQNAVLSTVDIDDDRKVGDILGSLDLGPLDKKSPTDGIDPFEIGTNQVFTPAMAGLPTVTSRFNQTKPKSDLEQLRDAVALTIQQTTRPQSDAQKGLQQNQAIQQGFNLGPLTFDDDLANFAQNERSRGFDEISRVGDDFDTALNLVDRNEADRLAAAQAMGVGTPPLDTKNITETALGARNKTTTDEPPPIVAPGIEAPKEFRDPFPNAGIKVGARTIPTIFSLANEFSKYSRGRVLDSIAQKGYTPVYDGDVIVGAKDKFGNLMEGMDPNAPMGSDDNQEPIIRKPIAPIVEEKKDDDKPPNIIGGGGTAPVLDTVPTVVASPFAPLKTVSNPVTFDAGDLNKLIEQLTGVSARPVVSAQDGGLIRAVDDFIATAK